MQEKLLDRKETWQTIFIFLAIVTITSCLFHYAIVNLYPSRIYIGALIWCPAIAAITTLKLKGRPISSLNWNWGNWKYVRLSYFVPALYVLITYMLIWLFGLGEEIGWRGFFIYELRNVLPFTDVPLFSGIVWASWHWSLIVYYDGNIALELTTFFVVIISMSFIMTYYTFKSNSLWPAVIFHAVSNVYVQKYFPR